MEDQILWASYFFGALLTLAYKFCRYLYMDRLAWMQKKGFETTEEMTLGMIWRPRRAALRWFFEPSAENASSWIATIGFVWIGGYVYIGRVPFLFNGWFENLPQHASVAFMLGFLMESIAPALTKLLVAKVQGFAESKIKT